MVKYIFILTTLVLSACGFFERKIPHCEYMMELSLLEKCAQKGDVFSKYSLGARYMNGQEAPQNFNQAFYWTEQAAEQGFPPAESNLGWLYYKGWGVQKDNKKAFEWMKRAAEKGNIPAYNNLGFFYSHGIGVPVNWKKGAEYYQVAVDNGLVKAYESLAVLYAHGRGVPQDKAKALELAKQSVNGGNQTAIYNVGSIYSSMGKTDEAVLWLKKAAELNISMAQAELASELAETAKTEAEKQEVRQWLEKALAQNDPYAYAVAGVLYTEKNNVFPVDEAKAYEYYMKAARMEEETSQAILAEWFWEGRYVAKDEKKAVEWFERSANNGEIKAAKKLVEIYGKGTQTIPKNEAQKQYWESKLAIE